MNVGWVGLGKLGLPIAEEIAKTHDVFGFDTDPNRIDRCYRVHYFTSRADLLGCDLIFVAVQTPHEPEFDGTHPLSYGRSDFDYTHLTGAVKELAAAGSQRPPLVIVSTVLPGTIEREVLPLWDGPVVYNPFFVAMGEEVEDFLEPEFVLCGFEGERNGLAHSFFPLDLIGFYRSLGIIGAKGYGAQLLTTSYREAEIAKLAYNTFIGMKIAFANTIGELCHRLGANSENVAHVLHHARKRLISTAYLDAGMGDGGPCHPRDNIAMSWLARTLGTSYDLFGAIMESREAHARWLAELIEDAAYARPNLKPVTLLGKAYKPDTDLEDGSPALLLARILDERGIAYTHEA